MNNLLKNNLFLILLIMMVAFSFIVPAPGLFINRMGLLPVLTFLAMFLSGLSLTLTNITQSIKKYKLIIFSSVTEFMIFPAVAFGLALVFFASSYDSFVGAMIISTQASTVTTAIVLTMAAGGSIPLAIIITIVNSVVSVFVSPLLLKLLLSMDNTIDFSVGGMILNLAIVLIIPLVLAQLFKRFLPKAARMLDPWRKKTANLIILLFVMIGASNAASEIKGNFTVIILIIVFSTILHFVIIGISYLYTRLVKAKSEDVPALIFCSSEKTMTTSTMIWGTYFSQYALAPLVIVGYHLIQIITDSVIAAYMSKIKNRILKT